MTIKESAAPRRARLPIWRRLGWRLTVAVLLLTAVGILASGLLQYRAQERFLRESLGGLLLNIARTGALLVDGGLTGRAPVLEALAAGPAVARAVVVMSYAPEERGMPPTTMRRALEEAFEMGMIHQIRRDVELARLKFPGVEVQLLTPSASLALRPLDFEPAGIARALERGRADAAACLSDWGTR